MNKQTTIRAVARKTGQTYFEVQTMLEALITVWSEALANGEQISIHDFLTIKVAELKTHRRGRLRNHLIDTRMPKSAYRLHTRMSQVLKQQIARKQQD